MKYYCYNSYTLNEDGSHNPCVKIYIEAEILKEWREYWKEKVIYRCGEEYFKTLSEKDCIEDWIMVNWAWETTVDIPQETL